MNGSSDFVTCTRNFTIGKIPSELREPHLPDPLRQLPRRRELRARRVLPIAVRIGVADRREGVPELVEEVRVPIESLETPRHSRRTSWRRVHLSARQEHRSVALLEVTSEDVRGARSECEARIVFDKELWRADN